MFYGLLFLFYFWEIDWRGVMESLHTVISPALPMVLKLLVRVIGIKLL